MWIGKFIGGLIGFYLFGIVGALIGALIGNAFDKLSGNFGVVMNAAQRGNIQQVFFKTSFIAMGRLAKADGRVSEEEIAHIQQFMVQLGLTQEHRQEAIRLFKEGAASATAYDSALREFQQVCGTLNNLKQMLMTYLIGVALADGVLHSEEEKFLRNIAQTFGYSPTSFDELIGRIKAQDRFSRDGHVPSNDLADAYQALGVVKTATDVEVKKAYRRLMSEYHPDKLIGQGVPEDMIKVATERSQEVRAAYDLITKSRR